MLLFLESFITFNSNHKCTKFESPVYNLLPTVVTNIAYESRRNSGFCLCHQCVRHVADPKFYAKNLDNFMTLQVDHNSEKKLAFH